MANPSASVIINVAFIGADFDSARRDRELPWFDLKQGAKCLTWVKILRRRCPEDLMNDEAQAARGLPGPSTAYQDLPRGFRRSALNRCDVETLSPLRLPLCRVLGVFDKVNRQRWPTKWSEVGCIGYQGLPGPTTTYQDLPSGCRRGLRSGVFRLLPCGRRGVLDLFCDRGALVMSSKALS